MHRLLMVIRREYFDRVKKKSFWVGIALFPVIMVAMMVIPMLLVGASRDQQWKIAVVDATGRLSAPAMEALRKETLKDGQARFLLEPAAVAGTVEEARRALEPRVHSGELTGILTIGPDIEARDNVRFYGRKVGDIFALRILERGLEKAIVELRMERLNVTIEPATFLRLTAPIDIESFELSDTGEAKKKGFGELYFGTFIFVFILSMSVLLYGVGAMRGILEEKSSRVMEVLLGSLSPGQLMTGKILGIGLVGLTQMLVYLVTAAIVQVWGASRVTSEEVSVFLDLLAPARMAYFMVFFVLGYFLYTALFAAIGAVCNTEQEAQNIQAPITWLLMLPMIATIYFVRNPDSPAAVVFSLIPLFTPMVMFMRICLLTPPFWQIALSIVLTAVTTWLVFRGVAKVFRIGVLMYGKRPSIPEILRWARS